MCAILQTDLSSAFDTVDTNILLRKLEHYGVRDKELALFTDYLNNRKQFVQIDTFKSNIINSPQCSVSQGSKLSCILYTIYVNEVPLLHKLMNTIHYSYVTGKPTKYIHNVGHTSIMYIDDCTNLIYSTHNLNISRYLTDYYTLLYYFYTANMLLINSDKTDLLVTCKSRFMEDANKITMKSNEFTIKQKKVTKILGYKLSCDLKHD